VILVAGINELVQAAKQAPNYYADAFALMTRDRPHALFVARSASYANRQRIIDFAGEHRLPGTYHSREFVEVGGLMSYGPRPPRIAIALSRKPSNLLGRNPGKKGLSAISSG
jgi:hypothetical protein